MSKITFAERKGKDLFDFLKAVQVDIKTAKTWALENFVLVDGKPLTIEQIAKLRNDVYIILTEKVFSTEVGTLVEENNTGIVYKEYTIKRKTIHRDFITEIQALQKDKRSKDNIDLIRLFLVKFFEVSEQDIEILPYELVAYMFRECNSFLESVTQPTNELNIDNIFTDDTPGNVSEGMADMVQ